MIHCITRNASSVCHGKIFAVNSYCLELPVSGGSATEINTSIAVITSVSVSSQAADTVPNTSLVCSAVFDVQGGPKTDYFWDL